MEVVSNGSGGGSTSVVGSAGGGGTTTVLPAELSKNETKTLSDTVV